METLNWVINLFPSYSDAFLARGQIHINNHNYEEAIKDFKFALTIMPNKLIGYLGLGDVYKLNGNLKKALKQYNKAIADPQ